MRAKMDVGEGGGGKARGDQQRGVVQLRRSIALSSLRSFDHFSFSPTQANFFFFFNKKKSACLLSDNSPSYSKGGFVYMISH